MGRYLNRWLLIAKSVCHFHRGKALKFVESNLSHRLLTTHRWSDAIRFEKRFFSSLPSSCGAYYLIICICLDLHDKFKWTVIAVRNRRDVTIECDHYCGTFQFVDGNCVEKSQCLLIQIDLISPNIRIGALHATSTTWNLCALFVSLSRSLSHTLLFASGLPVLATVGAVRRSSRRQTRYPHFANILSLAVTLSLTLTTFTLSLSLSQFAQNKRCNI